MKNELERVSKGKKMVGGIDTSRYALTQPTVKDPEAWETALKRSKVLLEHQNLRYCKCKLKKLGSRNYILCFHSRLKLTLQKWPQAN